MSSIFVHPIKAFIRAFTVIYLNTVNYKAEISRKVLENKKRRNFEFFSC